MLGMSQEQLLGLLRQLLPVLGTLAVTLGIMTPDQVGKTIALILNIAGPILIIWSAVWSVMDKTQAALVAKVDVIAKDPNSPVVGIVTTNTIEGRELAASVEGNTTAPAGTAAAANIAKAA